MEGQRQGSRRLVGCLQGSLGRECLFCCLCELRSRRTGSIINGAGHVKAPRVTGAGVLVRVGRKQGDCARDSGRKQGAYTRECRVLRGAARPAQDPVRPQHLRDSGV